MLKLKLLCTTFSLIGLMMANILFSSEQANAVQQEETINCIPRDLLFGNPVKTSPHLSPDGKQLAYIAPNQQNVLNVWIKDLDHPDSSDQMVTSDQKRGIRHFFWQFDNQHILYIQDQDGDENWHLYQTNIQTKATKDLTPYEGVKISLVNYDYKFPQTLLIQMNHRNKALFDVYRINLTTGQLELNTENFNSVFHWVADHQLQVRAAQAYKPDGSTVIYIRDTIESPWKELLTIDPNEIGNSVVGFTADNASLYLVSSLGANTSRLVKVELATGKQETLVEDKQYDLSNVLINPTTYQLEAAEIERDKLEWVVLDYKMNWDFDKLRHLFKGPFKIFSRDLKNTHWVIASFSDQRPTHFYLYDRQAGRAHFLFSPQPALEQYELSEMKPITFQARDGMKIFGYLTLPKGKSVKNLPAVLLVHGGPWLRDSWGLQPSVQWLANRGYAVLQVNYRGSTGYGKEYLNAGNREWAGKMHHDLLDGKQWLIDQGYADPSKIAIYGGSYGGYATLVGLAFTPDEFCCGVDVVGPSNLVTLLQTIPAYWGPLKAQTDRRLGSIEKDEDFLKERSPLYKAAFIKKPLLIAQGANDPRVKQSESDQIVEAMRKNQLPVEYLLFTDEGHCFAKPQNRLKFFAAVEAFLARHLGGRCQPPSPEEEWESLRK